MSKLNIKVVDMEAPVTETAKKVRSNCLLYNLHRLFSQSMRLSRTTARSASSPTRSRKTSTRSMVSYNRHNRMCVYRPLLERDRGEELRLARRAPDQELPIRQLRR